MAGAGSRSVTEDPKVTAELRIIAFIIACIVLGVSAVTVHLLWRF